MTLYRLREAPDLISPSVVVAFDGWVDAGGAATAAAEALVTDGHLLATFDSDALFDYRARRPTLEIIDGRPAELTWPAIELHRVRMDDRDVLILHGHEPDFRWQELGEDLLELARRFSVAEWISLGAIPAAVPHTRPVTLMGIESSPGLLRGAVQAGPTGLLRVPSAALSVLDMAIARGGLPALGYFAQIPHYVSGAYPSASLALLNAVGRHLGVQPSTGDLRDEARQLRARLDTATAADEDTRAYVERLEAMVDESRLPAGDDLISDIERFLRDRGTEGSQRPGP
ncbi:MAG: proteasome assembly chaperone family protein [Candidatus Limnocylindrales bacterium]